MILKECLKIQNITIKQFAKKIGVSRSQVHKYMHEGATPSKEVMIRIFDVTSKAVTPNDFHGITLEITETSITQYREQRNVKY